MATLIMDDFIWIGVAEAGVVSNKEYKWKKDKTFYNVYGEVLIPKQYLQNEVVIPEKCLQPTEVNLEAKQIHRFAVKNVIDINGLPAIILVSRDGKVPLEKLAVSNYRYNYKK